MKTQLILILLVLLLAGKIMTAQSGIQFCPTGWYTDIKSGTFNMDGAFNCLSPGGEYISSNN